MMERKTVTLSRDSIQVLEREAKRRRVSTSQLVREAIQKVYGPPAGDKRILPFESLGDSGLPGIAQNFDEALEAAGWADAIARDR
jgi:hypothetical protein